jgi:hypothetical protein
MNYWVTIIALKAVIVVGEVSYRQIYGAWALQAQSQQNQR